MNEQDEDRAKFDRLRKEFMDAGFPESSAEALISAICEVQIRALEKIGLVGRLAGGELASLFARTMLRELGDIITEVVLPDEGQPNSGAVTH